MNEQSKWVLVLFLGIMLYVASVTYPMYQVPLLIGSGFAGGFAAAKIF